MTFKDFVDIVDTPGGHIITAIFLGVFGVGVTAFAEYFMWTATAKAAAMLTSFLTVASYAMRGQEKANGKYPPKVVEKIEEKKPDDKQP